MKSTKLSRISNTLDCAQTHSHISHHNIQISDLVCSVSFSLSFFLSVFLSSILDAFRRSHSIITKIKQMDCSHRIRSHTQVHCNDNDVYTVAIYTYVYLCSMYRESEIIYRVSIFTLHLTSSSAVAKTFQETDFHFPMPFSVWCLSQCVYRWMRASECARTPIWPIQFAIAHSAYTNTHTHRYTLQINVEIFVNAPRECQIPKAHERARCMLICWCVAFSSQFSCSVWHFLCEKCVNSVLFASLDL